MTDHMRTCPVASDNIDVLLQFCARTLDADRTRLLDEHLASCAACGEMVHAQQTVWAALDAWEPEPVSAGFDNKLFARIEDVTRVPFFDRLVAPLRRMFAGGLGYKPALSLGAASLAIAAGIFFQSSGNHEISSTTPSVIETREIEQVERTLEDMDMLRQLDAVSQKDMSAAPASKAL